MHRAAAYLAGAAQGVEGARMQVLEAPKVLKRPHMVPSPSGDERQDNYYWLRDDAREDPEVIEHLKVKCAVAALRWRYILFGSTLALACHRRDACMHGCGW